MGYPLRQGGYLSAPRVAAGRSRVLFNIGVATSSMTAVSETAYAKYVGAWSQTLTSLDVELFIHGVAAAGAGWAEVAVATGDYTAKASATNLTILGYADVDAEVKVASTRIEVKTISGISIPANKDIWILFASSHATTQASLRTDVTDFHGDARTRASTRPSTNLNTALQFDNSFAGITIPMLRAVVTS